MNEMEEQKYVRRQREPLGKTIMRNYKFPEITKEESFRFGVETLGSINNIFFSMIVILQHSLNNLIYI